MAPDGPTTAPTADRGNRRLKQLDRSFGIPTLRLLGARRLLRRRREAPADWQRVGLIKTAAIGDVVLLSGIVRDLRAARSTAHIVVFATATNAGFARLLDDVDEVVVLPVRKVARALRLIREQRLDVCVDCGAWPRLDALLTALSGARWTVGRRTPGQHRHYAFDEVVSHSSSDHELENFRRLVRTFGVDSTSPPHLRVPPGPRPLAAPYAVLHLWPGGANSRERSWPEPSWASLAHSLNDRGLAVVLTGGPGDATATLSLVDAWQAAGIQVTSAAGGSAEQCARWLGNAAGVVSVNTGVMHVAAALGVPTVALNGPTSGRRWGPIGPHTRSVASPAAPDGYLDLGFERDARYADCMRAISVPAVLGAWDELRAAAPSTNRSATGSVAVTCVRLNKRCDARSC